MVRQLQVGAVAATLVVVSAVGGYALVLGNVVDPTWMGKVASLGFCVGLALLLTAPFLPTLDRAPAELDRWIAAARLWTTAALLAAVFWELPFVLLSFGPIRGATADDHAVWLWWLYGVTDTGYLTANPLNVVMEASMVVLVPLEIWILRSYRRQQYSRAAILTIVVAAAQFYALSLYYAIAALNGFSYVTTDVFDLVVKFVGLNIFWIVGPAVQIWGCSRLLLRRTRDPDALVGVSSGPDSTSDRPHARV